jgi:tRNA-2-methylthio-N6-dimethylallyladenosine synthase
MATVCGTMLALMDAGVPVKEVRITKIKTGGGLKKEKLTEEEAKNSTSFAQLLEMVAQINPDLRVRFSTSHPKDMTDEALYVMAKYENICNNIHLPVQSGSSRMLDLMNRGYTREWYMNRIETIRKVMPDCGISTDIITGFCSETDEDQKETLSLMEWARFDFAYMYKYSERPNTMAQRKFEDDIPEEVKSKRLSEVIVVQRRTAEESNKKDLGTTHKVLVEGLSKKSDQQVYGRNSQNKVIVFAKENFKRGDYVNVLVEDYTSATLMGSAIK